ncbi:MAG: hypothetical protein K0S20_758 [Patescibacteria group bacterium]|jgi:hypothetical protein|nr:hypothetical protein [Patescibacteria group bacterium]
MADISELERERDSHERKRQELERLLEEQRDLDNRLAKIETGS